MTSAVSGGRSSGRPMTQCRSKRGLKPQGLWAGSRCKRHDGVATTSDENLVAVRQCGMSYDSVPEYDSTGT